MSQKSAIEWTDASWNPIRARNLKTGKIGWHCEHSTTGCEFCYAEGFNKRLGTGLPFKPGHRKDIEIFLDEEMLLAPLRWKKPRTIFVCSMTDLFAEFVKNEWIDRVFAVKALCPQHTFQVLTKRAQRMRQYLDTGFSLMGTPKRAMVIEDHLLEFQQGKFNQQSAIDVWPLPNVWLGVSCERQEEADERIPLLLDTPAAVRFISAEPLLGPVDLTRLCVLPQKPGSVRCGIHVDALRNKHCESQVTRGLGPLDWVIVGGESGPYSRPMHPQWARDIRDQCQAAGVPFFFKQWGTWSPIDGGYWEGEPSAAGSIWHPDIGPGDMWLRRDGLVGNGKGVSSCPPRVWSPSEMAIMRHIGKKAAGRLLDGREWNEFPVVAAKVVQSA